MRGSRSFNYNYSKYSNSFVKRVNLGVINFRGGIRL